MMWKNMSMSLSNVNNNIEDFLVESITETHYESEDKKPTFHREDGKFDICNKPWTQWMPILCCQWCHMWYQVSNY